VRDCAVAVLIELAKQGADVTDLALHLLCDALEYRRSLWRFNFPMFPPASSVSGFSAQKQKHVAGTSQKSV
jgi:hypothetical protein